MQNFGGQTRCTLGDVQRANTVVPPPPPRHVGGHTQYPKYQNFPQSVKAPWAEPLAIK